MTAEHVIPDAIGGNIQPVNPFVLNNVCRECNSASGRHIDSPFIHSRFIHDSRSHFAFQYANLQRPTALPLSYLGSLTLPNGLVADSACELWLGPTGDSIFYLHAVDARPDVSGQALSPHMRQLLGLDPGIAFLFVRATNPVWHPTIVQSVCEHFRGTTVYFLNGRIEGNAPGNITTDVPSDYVALIEHLRSILREPINLQIQYSLSGSERFLAKVGLGLGGLWLGQDFLVSPYATILRDYLWARDPEARREIQRSGQLSLNADFVTASPLSKASGHTVMMTVSGGKVVVVFTVYGKSSGTIAICDAVEPWINLLGAGRVHFIAPSLQRAAGPYDLFEWAAALQGMHFLPELTEIDAQLEQVTPRPSFDL